MSDHPFRRMAPDEADTEHLYRIRECTLRARLAFAAFENGCDESVVAARATEAAACIDSLHDFERVYGRLSPGTFL